MKPMAFRRALVVTIALQSASLVFTAVFILLTARWLGPAGKGVQSLLVSIGQIGAMLCNFGYQGALVAVVSADRGQAPAATHLQVRLLGLAGIILVAASLLNAMVGWVPLSGFQMANLVVFALATILQVFFANIALVLRNVWTSNFSTALTAAVPLVAVILLRWLGTVTPDAVLWWQSTGLLAGSALAFVRLRGVLWPGKSFDPLAHLKRYRRPAILGYLSALFSQLILRGDIFLVTLLGGGARSAGIYSIGVFTAEVALKIPNWAAAVLTPSVAADGEKGRRQTVKLFWLCTVMAVFAFIVSYAAGPQLTLIITKMAGRDFAEAYPVMMAIFPRIVLQSGTAILAGNLAGKGFTLYHPVAMFAGMVGVWAFDALLIPRYGLVGAAWGNSLGFLFAAVIMFIGFLRHNGLSFAGFVEETAVAARPVVRSTTSREA